MARRDDWERTLAFHDGGLIFAKTNVPGERLGAILANLGRLSPEDAASIPSLTSSGQMIGEALIAKRLITHKDLYEALLAQMSRITLALFSEFEAQFHFEARERIVDIDFEMRMYLPQLIELGIREMPFHPALIDFLGLKFPVAGGSGSSKTLSADEKILLASLDGRRSGEATSATSALEPKTFWKTLFLLYCLDLARWQEPAPAAASVPEASPEPPASSAPPDAPAEIPTEIGEVLEFHSRLPKLDYYQILGVGRAAGEDEIKKAYFKLARKFHPDRFGRQADSEIREKIDAVFDAVTKAYRTLTSRDKRAMYSSKQAGPAPADDKDRGRNAEIRFRQGKTLFSQGRYEEALALLEEAVRLKDDKGDYYLLLAMAESKVPDLSKKAERNFLRAIEIEAWNPEAYVGLGYLYKREGLALRARKQFEKALELDPEHKAARQGLDETDGKVDGKKRRKGILSKDLFGGKKS
ncbi:MAG: DnaJ domain-containing protein [Candidatus Aminicenantes bacterium]|nr:DnaJ domain-containing protein [Candidatus Aminicenantes bacterium]